MVSKEVPSPTLGLPPLCHRLDNLATQKHRWCRVLGMEGDRTIREGEGR